MSLCKHLALQLWGWGVGSRSKQTLKTSLWSFPIRHADWLQGNMGMSFHPPLSHPGSHFFSTFFIQSQTVTESCQDLVALCYLFGLFCFPTRRICLGRLAKTPSIRSYLLGNWSLWVLLMWDPRHGHQSLFQSTVMKMAVLVSFLQCVSWGE